MKVTDDEHVHDSKALPEIIEKIIESDDNVTAIGKLLGDGAYEGNDVFRYLSHNGICLPCIIVRKNAKVRWKKGISLEICQFWHKQMICKSEKT